MKKAKFKVDFISPVGQEPFVVNTGDWRYQRPLTNSNRCRMCAHCWLVCPTSSRFSNNSHFATDLAYCKGCGICANECPARAIAMVEEPRVVPARAR